MWLLLLGAGDPSQMELTGEEGIKGTRAEGKLGLAASGFGSSPAARLVSPQYQPVSGAACGGHKLRLRGEQHVLPQALALHPGARPKGRA